MKQNIILLLCGLFSILSSAQKPDFAFPDAVIKDADTRLEHSLSTHDGCATVRALIDFAVAKNLMSRENMPTVIGRIETVAKSDVPASTRSMIQLLEARLLCEMYISESYRYDQRTLPLRPLPDNCALWSGAQFKMCIDSLLTESLSSRKYLKHEPSKSWSSVIDGDAISWQLYPTLYDFVALQALEIYNKTGQTKQRDNLLASLVDDLSTPASTAIGFLCTCKHGADDLLALYNKYSDTEWSLMALSNIGYSQQIGYYDALKQAVARFPYSPYTPYLKSRIEEILCRSVSAEVQSTFIPGIQGKVKLHVRNATQINVKYWHATRSEVSNGVWRPTKQRLAKPDGKTTIMIDRDAPFECDTTIQLTLPEAGLYGIIVSFPGDTRDFSRMDKSMVQCSEGIILTPSLSDNCYPYVVSTRNGAPISDIPLWYRTKPTGKYTRAGATDTYGSITPGITSAGARLYLKASINSNDSITATSNYLYKPIGTDATIGSIFTSLPIYKPDEEVQWSAVIYTHSGAGNRIAPNHQIIARITDPSGNELALDTLCTDDFGRITGSTVLPKETMGGRCMISLSSPSSHITTGWFTVNDYRLPSFKCDVTKVLKNETDIDIYFNASTYTGFALPGSKAVLTMQPFEWWSEQPIEYSDTVCSDTEGNGHFKVPVARLKAASEGFWHAVITVTSPGGENATCSTGFSLGKPYRLSANIPDAINLEKETDFATYAVDCMGEKVEIPVSYTFTSDTGERHLLTTLSDLKKFQTGTYSLKIAPLDTTLAQPVELKEIALYRIGKQCPVDKSLWVPIHSFETGNGKVDIPYGSCYGDAKILVMETVDSVLSKRYFVSPGQKMTNLTVDVPDGSHIIKVTFLSVYNSFLTSSDVTIKNQRTDVQLDVVVEHIIDDVLPGSKETIKLNVSQNGIPQRAAVMMAMNSASIRTLQPFKWSLDIPYNAYPSLRGYYLSQWSTQWGSSTFKSIKKPASPDPEFQLYGYNWLPGRYISELKLAAGAKMEMYRSAQTTDAVEEVADAEDAGHEVNGATTASGAEDTTQYRPAEEPLALFATGLCTDEQGNVTYEYTVPQANTEWILDIIAYNDAMKTTAVHRKIIATRPVMVQTSLPRYLRTGDQTVLRSVVMNNSDADTTVTVTVNVDGNTLISEALEIPRNDLRKIDIPYTVPQSINPMEYVVKASIGKYTDAVRTHIGVLPATQPVIESDQFYIPSDSASFHVEVDGSTSSQQTLSLCSDPLWQVITALSSGGNDYVTSTGAANSLSQAAVAKHLLRQFPMLRDFIESLNDSISGPLTANAALKQQPINLTPWLLEAMDEGKRLITLASMLDENNLNQNISQAIATLLSTSNPDGSLSWTPGRGVGSMWATLTVVSTLSELERKGILPADKRLEQIMTAAIRYLDQETLRRYRQGAKTGYADYVLARQNLKKHPVPAANRPIFTATVNEILKTWTKQAPVIRARYAVILRQNGYRTMARRIAGSLISNSVYSPSTGRTWAGLAASEVAQILKTVKLLMPERTETIGQIVQWLLLDKINRNWGNNATATVATVIESTTIPQSPAEPVCMHNGDTLSLATQFPGTATARLNHVTGEIEIIKNSTTAAYGSIVTKSMPLVSEIKASKHPWLEVDSRMVTGYGQTASYTDIIEVGQKLSNQITLSIKQGVDYVIVDIPRASGLEPAEQLSGYQVVDSKIYVYREVTDNATRLYIESLDPGTYIIDIGEYALAQGVYACPAVTVQSQYNPTITAHSSGTIITIQQ